ncbi:MAG: hypothetical protein QXI38_04880, partial [Conexivisphaerales archaeon]
IKDLQRVLTRKMFKEQGECSYTTMAQVRRHRDDFAHKLDNKLTAFEDSERGESGIGNNGLLHQLPTRKKGAGWYQFSNIAKILFDSSKET